MNSTRSQYTRSAYKDVFIYNVNKHMETKVRNNVFYDCSINEIHSYKSNKTCPVLYVENYNTLMKRNK